MCLCLCVSFALHWEFRATLFLCLSHFLINISPFLLLFSPSFPFTLSFSLGHQNKISFFFILSMLRHTLLKGWLAGWSPRWDAMSCIWRCTGSATARWLQTILFLFVFNLYRAGVGGQDPTDARAAFTFLEELSGATNLFDMKPFSKSTRAAVVKGGSGDDGC